MLLFGKIEPLHEEETCNRHLGVFRLWFRRVANNALHRIRPAAHVVPNLERGFDRSVAIVDVCTPKGRSREAKVGDQNGALVVHYKLLCVVHTGTRVDLQGEGLS